MKIFGKALFVLTVILGLLNAIIFIGSVVKLLEHWVGFAAYFLWTFAAPLLSPAIIALPWFDAWVASEPINERLLAIWGAFIVCLILRVIFWKWAPDR